MIPAQCRAARALLDVSQQALADASEVGLRTISSFENEEGSPTRATVRLLRTALENMGVEFLDDDRPGVRLR